MYGRISSISRNSHKLFRVLFDDFLFVQCNDGEFIGNGESHVLRCEMLNGNETLV